MGGLLARSLACAERGVGYAHLRMGAFGFLCFHRINSVSSLASSFPVTILFRPSRLFSFFFFLFFNMCPSALLVFSLPDNF